MNRAVFFDRDQTIVETLGDPTDASSVRLIRGAAYALASLRLLGYRIIVVTNQGGVARGVITEADVDAVHQRVAQLAHESASAIIDRFYYCPFHPDGTVENYRRDHSWRKPKPGMLQQAARDLELNMAESWMVGDQERDIEAGLAADCQTILVKPAGSKATLPTRAHFVVETLAEAAAVIAQNRTRSHQFADPIIVTKSARKVVSADRQVAVTDKLIHAQKQTVKETSNLIHDADPPCLQTEKNIAVTPSPERTFCDENKRPDSTPTSQRELNVAADPKIEFTDAPQPGPSEITTATKKEAHQIASDSLTEQDDDPNHSPTCPIVPQVAPPAKRTEPTEPHFHLPPVQSSAEEQSQVDERSNRILMDLIGEVRSWRASTLEFTPLRLFAFVAMIFILLGAVSAAIYLERSQALSWVGVSIVAQLTVIGLLILNPRG